MASEPGPFLCVFYLGISSLIFFSLLWRSGTRGNPLKQGATERALLGIAFFYALTGLVLLPVTWFPWQHSWRQTVSSLDPWLLLLAFSLWLKKYPPQTRNPLEWSEVDRALLLVWIFLLINGMEQLEILLMPWGPDELPWIDKAFARAVIPISRVEGAFVFILLLIGLWLRHHAPQTLSFAHVALQYAAAAAAFNAYVSGAVTSPNSFLAGLAVGAFALLLFPPRVALPAIVTFMLLTVGSTIAAGSGLIPYAPQFAQSPVAGGRIESAYLASSLTWAAIISLLVLSLMTFVLIRWRDREGKLREMTSLLKKMFGRYLSTEVMNAIIENPSSLELGGERRRVTIMMTDLRGFTSLSERLQPEQVVQMLNGYFEVMVDIILEYQGTINEIIGDALLVVFGAPHEIEDRAQRAVACAIAMQNAMARVNAANRAQGLPDIKMGIGLNESEVVVGNIGSSKRSKYSVVESGVNMASRIESYTVGGQVLISESVRNEAGDVLRIDGQREILPKGAGAPLRVYDVGGIGGKYNLLLEWRAPDPIPLVRSVPVRCTPLEGKKMEGTGIEGLLVGLSERGASLQTAQPLRPMTNLRMNLAQVADKLASKDFYGKVTGQVEKGSCSLHEVRFTSVPPVVDAYIQALLRYDATP